MARRGGFRVSYYVVCSSVRPYSVQKMLTRLARETGRGGLERKNYKPPSSSSPSPPSSLEFGSMYDDIIYFYIISRGRNPPIILCYMLIAAVPSSTININRSDFCFWNFFDRPWIFIQTRIYCYFSPYNNIVKAIIFFFFLVF